jgi:hypothetical protein
LRVCYNTKFNDYGLYLISLITILKVVSIGKIGSQVNHMYIFIFDFLKFAQKKIGLDNISQQQVPRQ